MEGLSSQESRWQRIKTRMKHHYRLVLMDNDTFEEVGSYKLSLLNVYILLSSLIVLTAIGVTLLFIYTPMKTLIPGFVRDGKDAQILELGKKVEEQEEQLEAQALMISNIQKIMRGDVVEAKPEQIAPEAVPHRDSQVARIKEDELLRQEVALNQQIRTRSTQNGSGDDLPLDKLVLVAPVKGVISEHFNPQKKHFGTDLVAPKNTPVQAALDGYVFMADYTLETGYTIGIQHSYGIITFYKHNAALLKKVGDHVKAGEALAIIGNTGTLSNGPHLHFELWKRGVAVDAARYIHLK